MLCWWSNRSYWNWKSPSLLRPENTYKQIGLRLRHGRCNGGKTYRLQRSALSWAWNCWVTENSSHKASTCLSRLEVHGVLDSCWLTAGILTPARDRAATRNGTGKQGLWATSKLLSCHNKMASCKTKWHSASMGLGCSAKKTSNCWVTICASVPWYGWICSFCKTCSASLCSNACITWAIQWVSSSESRSQGGMSLCWKWICLSQGHGTTGPLARTIGHTCRCLRCCFGCWGQASLSAAMASCTSSSVNGGRVQISFNKHWVCMYLRWCMTWVRLS